MPQETPTPPASSPWALLVGIDEYAAHLPPLRGCVNDVAAMRIFLMNQLGVPPANIRMLTNAQARRADLIRAFEEFLIDNPSVRHGDQILFHFSGHGSRMRDPHGVEADGYLETIVPHDSRVGDVFDVP